MKNFPRVAPTRKLGRAPAMLTSFPRLRVSEYFHNLIRIRALIREIERNPTAKSRRVFAIRDVIILKRSTGGDPDSIGVGWKLAGDSIKKCCAALFESTKKDRRLITLA